MGKNRGAAFIIVFLLIVLSIIAVYGIQLAKNPRIDKYKHIEEKKSEETEVETERFTESSVYEDKITHLLSYMVYNDEIKEINEDNYYILFANFFIHNGNIYGTKYEENYENNFTINVDINTAKEFMKYAFYKVNYNFEEFKDKDGITVKNNEIVIDGATFGGLGTAQSQVIGYIDNDYLMVMTEEGENYYTYNALIDTIEINGEKYIKSIKFSNLKEHEITYSED